MGKLRDQMQRDMELKYLSSRTKRCCPHWMSRFVRHYRKPPDQLGDAGIKSFYKEARSLLMIKKVVNKVSLTDRSSAKRNLAYWLSRTPEERVAAIDILRRQYHGTSNRLERTARVIQQASS